MDVAAIVKSTITRVAVEHGICLPSVEDTVSLLDSGLDSLCLAVIVAHLEDELGVDPFQSSEDGALPVTIGGFVGLYDNAVHQTVHAS